MIRPIVVFSFALSLLTSLICAAQPSSKPSEEGAWPLYAKAAQRVHEGDLAKIESPSSSNLVYAGYPPFPPEWHRMEKASYAFNASARALVREARSRETANWPAQPAGGKFDFAYLSPCRALANEVGDAALFEHLQGDDAAAVESIRDLLHLADLLDAGTPPFIILHLVAVGIRALAVDRLVIITSDASLTEDPADLKRLQVRIAKELIRQLFDARNLTKQFGDLLDCEPAAKDTIDKSRFLTTLRRIQMECNLSAMSLACHLFYRDKSRWPASVDEVASYLPAKPLDAFGAMGYVLVKAGLPNGSDRPLVYSHCNSKDGMFFRLDEPQYGFYQGDGTDLPRKQQKEGGQFRDVASWAPTGVKASPTTRPLP